MMNERTKSEDRNASQNPSELLNNFWSGLISLLTPSNVVFCLPTGERRLPGNVRRVCWEEKDISAHSKAPPSQTTVGSVGPDRLRVRE